MRTNFLDAVPMSALSKENKSFIRERCVCVYCYCYSSYCYCECFHMCAIRMCIRRDDMLHAFNFVKFSSFSSFSHFFLLKCSFCIEDLPKNDVYLKKARAREILLNVAHKHLHKKQWQREDSVAAQTNQQLKIEDPHHF